MKAEFLQMLITRYEEARFTVDRRITALIRERMPDDLTSEQYSILSYLSGKDTCTSSELSDVFCVGRSSITAIITRLADKELIRRVPHGSDRRVTYLKLTPLGEQLALQMKERVGEMLAGYMEHFDEKEAIMFIETYEKLARVLHQ